MKIGDLITKKSRSRLYSESTPALKTVVRVMKSHEPRLHGGSSFYIALDDDPGKWQNPRDYFIVSEA
jgi:hypothetical protein